MGKKSLKMVAKKQGREINSKNGGGGKEIKEMPEYTPLLFIEKNVAKI